MAIGGVQNTNIMSQIQVASALKASNVPQKVDNDKANEGFEVKQNEAAEGAKESTLLSKDVAITDIGKSMQANAAAIKAKVVQPQNNVQGGEVLSRFQGASQSASLQTGNSIGASNGVPGIANEGVTPIDQTVTKTETQGATQKASVLPPQLGNEPLAQLSGQERSQAQPLVREGTGGTTEVQARVNTERQQNNAVQLKIESSYGKKENQVSSAVGTSVNINA